MADSVKAILNGALAAANRLRESGLGSRVAIAYLEFLDIYQDLAIAAVQALEGVLKDTQVAARVDWLQRLIEAGEDGQRRIRCEADPL